MSTLTQLLILSGILLLVTLLLAWFARAFLVAVAYFADTYSRIVDFLLLRNIDKDQPLNWSRPQNLRTHSWAAIIPFMVLVPFLVVSNGNLGLWALKVLAIEMILLLATYAIPHRLYAIPDWLLHPLTLQILIVGGMTWMSFKARDASWSFGGPIHGSDGKQFPQMILVGILWLMLLARIGGPLISWFALKREKRGFKTDLKLGLRLHHVDLFVNPKQPDEQKLDVLSSLLAVPLREPVMLLYLPAVSLLVVRDRMWMLFVAIFVLCIWWNFIAMAILNKRLNTVLNVVRRLLFKSWMYWISMALIACAICRIVDFKYVNIMLEGDRVLFLQFFGTLYLAFWIFQYWTNRFVDEALLDLFAENGEKPSRAGTLNYQTSKDVLDTFIDKDNRKLQLHTGARFVTIGYKPDKGDQRRQEPLEDRAPAIGQAGAELEAGAAAPADGRARAAVDAPAADVEPMKGRTLNDIVDEWADSHYRSWNPDPRERFHFYERIPLLNTLFEKSDQHEAIRQVVTKRIGKNRKIIKKQLEKIIANEIASDKATDLASRLATEEAVDKQTSRILKTSVNAVTDINKASAKPLRNVIRAIGLCVSVLNVVVLIAIGILVWRSCTAIKDPMIEAAKDATGCFDLREAIFEAQKQSDDKPRHQAVLVSAAGGGTRAAIHAASVMDGIHLAGASDDVVLLSGISGGSVGLAYYAAYYEQLKQEPKFTSWEKMLQSKSRWNAYHEAMRANYISDVLLGTVNEWRVLSGRVTMGTLLAESLDAHFYVAPDQWTPSADSKANKDSPPSPIRSFATDHFGVILNTTITGTFPFEVPTSDGPHPADKRNHANLASAYHTGERLVFTNLKKQPGNASYANGVLRDGREFPGAGIPESPHEYLKYVVIRDTDVPIAYAAAASANFPPVFPNSAIDLYSMADENAAADERYWITDGGITDNRGIISLLYALRHALRRQKRLKTFKIDDIPEIHVVVAEASGVGLDYSHDRGSSAIINAKAKVTNQLMLTLIEEVQHAYQELQETNDAQPKRKVEIHYLSLPSPIRMRGGVGTHWMMPAGLELRDSRPANSDQAASRTLTGDQVARIMWEIHRPGRTIEKTKKVKAVWEWIKDDPWQTPWNNYDERWKTTMDALKK